MLLSSSWVGTWDVQMTDLEVQNGAISQSTQTSVGTITELGAGSFRLTTDDGLSIDLTGNETQLSGDFKGLPTGGGSSYDEYFRIQKFDNAYASVFSGRIDYSPGKSQITSADLSAGLATPQGAPVNTVSFPWRGNFTFYGLSAEATFNNPTAHSDVTTDTMTGSITSTDGLTYQAGPAGQTPDTFTLSGNQLVRSYRGLTNGGQSRIKSLALLMQGPGGRVFNAGVYAEFMISSGQIGYVSLDSGYTDPFNSAPILSATPKMYLDAINEDDRSNAGTLVSDVIARSGADNVSVIKVGGKDGIAVTGVNTACGKWQYSTDGGTTWTNVGVVSDSSALLLASNPQTRLRLLPKADFSGNVSNAVTFRAWDRSAQTNGARVDVSVNGNTRPYSSATATASIRVKAVNDAPVLSASAVTVKYIEGAAPVTPFAGLIISDVDSPNLTGAVIDISGYVAPEDKLTFANTAAITGTFDATTGMLTLTGTASQAAYQAAIRSVGYRDKSLAPNTTARTLSVTVNDGALESNELAQLVAVKAVNTAPVITAGTITRTGAAKNANFALTFETLNAALQTAGITYSDVDTAQSSLGFRITAFSGTLRKNGNLTGAVPVLLMRMETIVWKPATNATGNIAALKLEIWDGALASSAFVTVIINVV